ncbi:hypothetical protein D9M68_834170 [compost metagenome]
MITSGNTSSRGPQSPSPAMGVASETMRPLNPNSRRSRSWLRILLIDAGRNASAPASGSSASTKAGSAMWADMMLSTPASIAAR